jgi:pimeloyl-ACP methyl ester carboxylesterase
MGTSVLTEIVARHVNQQLPSWFSSGIKSLTFTNGSMVLELASLRMMQKLLMNKTVGPLLSRLSRYSLFRKTIISAHGAPIDEGDIELLWQNCVMQDGHKKNHHIIRYLNDRKRFEKTRWLPALRIASKSLATHICWGTADQVAKVEMAHYLKERVCPSAKLTLMPGAGHFCQLGSPELWVESVLAFYRK